MLWCADKSTRSSGKEKKKKALMCSIYWLLWYKYSHYVWFQATSGTSLNLELGRDAHNWVRGGTSQLHHTPLISFPKGWCSWRAGTIIFLSWLPHSSGQRHTRSWFYQSFSLRPYVTWNSAWVRGAQILDCRKVYPPSFYLFIQQIIIGLSMRLGVGDVVMNKIIKVFVLMQLTISERWRELAVD